jgi:hypothetical protein
MKWIEVATEPDAIRRVLAGLGHEDRHDARRRAPRSSYPASPEQLGFGFG